MNNRIVITGVGCISPLGNDNKTTWESIKAGKSGAGPITHFDPSSLKCQIAAEVKDFDLKDYFDRKQSRHLDPFGVYAVIAALDALENSGLPITEDNRDRIGAVIGSGIGGMVSLQEQFKIMAERGPSRVNPFMIAKLMPNNASASVALHLGLRGTNLALATACATGGNAIGEAAEIIRRGQADVMFAGGSESVISEVVMAGFDSMTALTSHNDNPEEASRPFDKERDGFLMGEGAGIVILESEQHAQDRGAKILAQISGYGSNNDAFHITSPAENGVGAVRCMAQAIEQAKIQPDQIDYINAHGTSTYLNDKNETAAIKTTFGEHAYNIPVSSTKSMTGHLLGAAGGIEAIFCINALQENIMPPTINYQNPDPECDLDYVPNQSRQKELNHVMSNSFGFGGHNATLIISKFEAVQ